MKVSLTWAKFFQLISKIPHLINWRQCKNPLADSALISQLIKNPELISIINSWTRKFLPPGGKDSFLRKKVLVSSISYLHQEALPWNGFCKKGRSSSSERGESLILEMLRLFTPYIAYALGDGGSAGEIPKRILDDNSVNAFGETGTFFMDKFSNLGPLWVKEGPIFNLVQKFPADSCFKSRYFNSH